MTQFVKERKNVHLIPYMVVLSIAVGALLYKRH